VSGFTILNGVAEISDPAIYANWLDNDEFKAAVALPPVHRRDLVPDPTRPSTAVKWSN
jgi:hypothetical protein